MLLAKIVVCTLSSYRKLLLSYVVQQHVGLV